MFWPGKTKDRVTLNTCTGWVRHMGRFYESKTYTFVLDVQLSKGNIELLLLDKEKQPLLKLNRQLTSQAIDLDRKSRYYLQWVNAPFVYFDVKFGKQSGSNTKGK